MLNDLLPSAAAAATSATDPDTEDLYIQTG